MAEETSISSIGTAAISIGVAIIVMTVMIIIVQTIGDTQTKDTTESIVGNETLAWGGNNTAIQLAHGRIVGGSETVYNNDTVVNRGSGDVANYSIDNVGGTITFLNSTLLWNGSTGQTHNPNQLVTGNLNVTYQFLLASIAKNITSDGLAAQNTLASFLPLIALAMVGAIVIGIVIRFFLKPNQ